MVAPTAISNYERSDDNMSSSDNAKQGINTGSPNDNDSLQNSESEQDDIVVSAGTNKIAEKTLPSTNEKKRSHNNLEEDKNKSPTSIAPEKKKQPPRLRKQLEFQHLTRIMLTFLLKHPPLSFRLLKNHLILKKIPSDCLHPKSPQLQSHQKLLRR